MILAIDASNIRNGGGLTHLKQILKEGEPLKEDINKVIIWSSQTTLDKIEDKDWLIKKTHSLLNKTFIHTFIFQLFYISKFLNLDNVDLLFVPGGTFLGSFRPIISMSQNMLPFEKQEYNRFPSFKSRLKFKLLNLTQSYTFNKSLGVIFLTNYAKESIEKIVNIKESKIVSHGINLNFCKSPKEQAPFEAYTLENPFKLLYVSIVTVYKHQWNIAEAILRLRKEGFPIALDFVGDSTPESLEKLKKVLEKDIYNCISYKGLIEYEKLSLIYKNADGFIFGSSCENQPIILLEAMSAGLPIISSNMGPMPEVLGAGQYYLNPLDINSIYTNLKSFLIDYQQRELLVQQSYQSSLKYTWKDCADITFKTLTEIFKNANNKK